MLRYQDYPELSMRGLKMEELEEGESKDDSVRTQFLLMEKKSHEPGKYLKKARK